MKKLFFAAIIAVFSLGAVNAQENETSTAGFDQGDVYVSGRLGFNSFKAGEEKSSNFNLSPSVGYFVSDNIAIEAGLNIGSNKYANDSKSSSFGGELGANYFFTPADKFSFTVGAGFAYSTLKRESSSGTESPKVNSFIFAVSPGLNYFVSDSFALRASIGALSYGSTKVDVDGAEASNNFGLNLNLSNINFGVTYKF